MACSKVISNFELWSAVDLGRRRSWSDAEKLRIVEESLQGHRQGSARARRHGISRSLLSQWRRDYRAGGLGCGGPTFAAVTLTPAATPHPDATIEIVLRCGRRMIVPASIDAAVLARLLSVVEA